MNHQSQQSSSSPDATAIPNEQHQGTRGHPTSAFESWLRQHHLVLHGQLARLEDRLLWLIRNDTGFALLCSDSWPPASIQIPLPTEAGELGPCLVSYGSSDSLHNAEPMRGQPMI